jgi:hypothetical protein
MSTAIRGFYRRYATSGDYTWHIDKRIKRVGRLCETPAARKRRPKVGQLIQAANRVLSPSTASSATLLRVAAALPARAGRSRLSLHERARGGGTTARSGSLPQNFLANFECVRGMRPKILVGAHGIEPPTFAL